MSKLAISTLSIGVLAAAASAQAVITPAAINNNPNLGIAVINRDANNTTITAIEQYELRPQGGGMYRCVVTAILGGADSSLVSGTLNWNTNPPVWTPNADLAALNVAGTSTDEFQGSMSLDGLVVVWDNYVGTTYPNVPVNATTFICKRASTSVPFATANVFGIQGMPAGGVDPHIGGERPNGDVVVYHLDANGNISAVDVNPNSGAQTSTPVVVHTNRGTVGGSAVGFAHSSYVQRDSTGRGRALTCSEYIQSTGAPSDGLWRNNLTNNGPLAVLAPAFGDPQTPWYANPTVNGGTWNWATAVAAYGDPTMVEACAICDADMSSGSGRMVVFAPISPANPARVFISVVGIGVSAPGYPVPPVVGDLLIFPTVGVTPIQFHDSNTGLAEWAWTLPGSGYGGPFVIQSITLDGMGNQILAGNTANLIVP